MMPQILDYALVLLAVALATGYLIRRKVRKARRLARDWTTGHSEICDSCPAVTIRQAQSHKSTT